MDPGEQILGPVTSMSSSAVTVPGLARLALGPPAPQEYGWVDLGSDRLSAVKHTSLNYQRNDLPFSPDKLPPNVQIPTYNLITAGPAGPACEQNYLNSY